MASRPLPEMDACPLVVNLPEGVKAYHVPGSWPPSYSLEDRADAGIDVTIPDDLLATGWFWSGSFLYQPWPGNPQEGPGVAISTGTFPPPGWPQEPIRVKGMDDQGQPIVIEQPRHTCFDSARILNLTGDQVEAMLEVKKPKKPKKPKKLKKLRRNSEETPKKPEPAQPPPPPPPPVVVEEPRVAVEQLELELV